MNDCLWDIVSKPFPISFCFNDNLNLAGKPQNKIVILTAVTV